MSWGDTFKAAVGAASDVAKAKAAESLATLAGAAAAVLDTAVDAYGSAKEWVYEAAGTVTSYGRTALQWGGEAVNTVVGGTVYKGAAEARKAKEMFNAVSSLFGDGDDTPSSRNYVVTPCPGRSPDIYSRAYRESLVNSHFNGADDPRLTAAMHQLNKASTQDEVEASLAQIAELRQRPLSEIQSEYQTYLGLQEDIARKVDDGAERIDALKDEQYNFMGSTWQMRYGTVVGDKFGVDAVFGAMLNPTGGLVGPGKEGWAPDGALMPEAVAYHGAYHDAMGHLSNYFDTGPGYNYMGSPIGLATTNPLAGQATGIAEWEVLLLRGGP